MAQNSLNANCVHFLGILMQEMDFWCMLNLLENIMDAGFFVYHCLLFRKTGKNFQFACVVFLFKYILF